MKSEFKNITDYEDTWAVVEGKMEGKHIIIRYREGLVSAIGHPSYPFQIGVAVPFNSPTENGLVSDEEAKSLARIEDDLIDDLGADNEAVFAMSITYNGMREFVFYASKWDPEYFRKKVNKIQLAHKNDHELQFMIQSDQEWTTFSTYVRR